MFEATIHSSRDERSQRGLTTVTSFGLQALAVGILVVLPLIRPAGLPFFRQLSTPVSLGRPVGEPPAAPHAGGSAAAPSHNPIIILRPSSRPLIDQLIPRGDDNPPVFPSDSAQAGPWGPGAPNGVDHGLGADSRAVMPAAPRPAAVPVRISVMREGDLIRKVVPTYPSLARMARIQGQVVLLAVISKDGVIENLRVLSGHPMLAPAAIEAVRQWRYRPYLLNSEPVEVETQVTVTFSLAGN